MMNISSWIGAALAVLLLLWGVYSAELTGAIANTHGVIIVLGGTSAAMLISCPLAGLWSALVRLVGLFLPQRFPSIEDSVDEIVRLARRARESGGLLALRDESRDFADGFVHRAITTAIATSQVSDTRRIMEDEIRQTRISRQEDANVFRTVGVLSPMFGILGTLLGMIKVLEKLTDPTQVGPGMALALSSAFLGIAIANFISVPVAGKIRLVAMKETLVCQVLLEGVLEILAGKSPYLIELHLASFSSRHRLALKEGEAAAPPAREAGPASASGRGPAP